MIGLYAIDVFGLLKEHIVGGLGCLEHRPGVAIDELLHLQAPLLLQDLEVVKNASILVLDVRLVLAHALFDLGDLFELGVELQLVQALLLPLRDGAPLGVPHRRFEHVAVHVALALVDGVDQALGLGYFLA